MDLIRPEWPVPARVRALMTTRTTSEEELRALLPAEPVWLRQVHGIVVADIDSNEINAEADAATTRVRNTVCAIKAADCMPVLLADEAGTVVGAAHAGWRGLAAGVVESTIREMRVPGKTLMAWLGPAIGARVYEVGDEVRAAFIQRDSAAAAAFSPTRPGHWLLDLYAVARQRLQGQGIERISGGAFCTYSEPARFYSYRRDGATGRMAAFIWLA